MRAVIISRPEQPWAHPWGQAFARGLERHGWQTTRSAAHEPSDLLVLWGTRRQGLIVRQKASGGDVCVLERGYMGDRQQWASVSFGGRLNGRATFHGPLAEPSRWERHFASLMHPWRLARGRVALILGQVPGDMSVRGTNLPAFYAQAAQAFRGAGYDVRFRPHPLESGSGAPISEALSDVAVAVTWNSNAGVDAVLAGVPTVAMDEGSMAWPVAGHELAPPPTPDRQAWAWAMAWKQWCLEEMASGETWAHVAGCWSRCDA